MTLYLAGRGGGIIGRIFESEILGLLWGLFSGFFFFGLIIEGLDGKTTPAPKCASTNTD